MNRRDMLKHSGIGAAARLMGAINTPMAKAQGGALNAVWVHGTAFEAEDPGALNGISEWDGERYFEENPKNSHGSIFPFRHR